MMATAVSRRLSSHKKVLIALLGLLFATSAFTSVSAKTKECKDDLDFVFKFKGEELNCEDVNSMTNEKKFKKICKKNKVKRKCPDTCGECEKKTCPLEKPQDGTKCKGKKKGLTCDYDFTYTGGCGPDAPISCTPISALTCGDDKTWSLSTFIDLPCVGDSFPPSGQTCDPAGCPLEKPQDGTKCKGKKKGLTCDYDFTYTGGCGPDAPISCMPISALTCGDDKTWSLSTFIDLPCVGDSFPPSGQTCDPADCPLTEPEKKKSCSEDLVGTSCGYDYQVTGCSPDDLTCSPSRIYTCEKKKNSQKWKLSLPEIDCKNSTLESLDTEPCDPTEFCPSLLPAFGSSCELSPGLDCQYEYIYSGCTFEGGFSCIPLTTAFCNTNQWEYISLIIEPCFHPELGIPSGTCEPCPEEPPEENCPLEKPEAGRECYIEGDCSYDFETTGCTADDIQCTPTSFFSCFEGRWVEGVVGKELCPPPIERPCPEEEPADTECGSNGFALGQKCEYNFRRFSCDEDSPTCVPSTFYYCGDGGEWQVAVADYFCLEYPPGFGDYCDPTDSEFCPEKAPENQTPCSNIGQNCDYGYSIFGCTLEEATCSPSSFYECTQEGSWQLSLTSGIFCDEQDPDVPVYEPCDPDTFCPLVKPSNQSKCSNVGLECYYDFRNVSCDEEEEICEGLEYYQCTDGNGWIVAARDYFCEENPPGFLDVCVP